MPHSMTFNFQLAHQAGRPVVTVALRRLHIAFRAYSTRHALAGLTTRELSDIGITPSAALAEAARLPWDCDPGPRPHRPGIFGFIKRTMEYVRAGRLSHDCSRLNAQPTSILVQPYG